MRTYHYTKPMQKETAEKSGAAEETPKVEVMEGSFDQAAYEWNNALRIAAEKMWGNHPPIERKFT